MNEKLQTIKDDDDNITSVVCVLDDDAINIKIEILFDKTCKKENTYIYYDSHSHSHKHLVYVIEGAYNCNNIIGNIITFTPKNLISESYGTQSGI